MSDIIAKILLKYKVFKINSINFPISIQNSCSSKFSHNLLNFNQINDLNNIYRENDIELLRYYLTLYPERLVTSI